MTLPRHLPHRTPWVRRLLTLALAVTFTAGIGAQDAWAGKKDDDKGKEEPVTIELTGVAAFDDVFTRVKAIDERLTAAESLLKTAKKDLITALELKQGTPLKEAIADLQAKADGKIKVAMNGKQPKLEPTEAVPANVQSAIDAVNRLTEGITGSIEELQAIPAEVTALVAESKSFPEKLTDELKADPTASLAKAPKILGTLKDNATVTTGLPDRSQSVVTRMTEMVDVVRTAFPLGEGGASDPAGDAPVADDGSGGTKPPTTGEEQASAPVDDASTEEPSTEAASTEPARENQPRSNVAEKLSGQAPGTRERRGGK